MTRSDVERTLKDHAVDADLEALVDAGCNRNQILDLLQLAFLADESWERQVKKMDLRQFKAAITQIRDCANIIDRLNESTLVRRASTELAIPQFVSLRQSPTLAEQLREYAGKMDLLRAVPRAKTGMHTWKALIVTVVTKHTKQPHDREVSSLISAVLPKSNYSLAAHVAWRLKHEPTIAMMRKLHHEDSCPYPPPPIAE